MVDRQHDGRFQAEHVLMWDRRNDTTTPTGVEAET
jgi:hypothetical protein